MSFRTQFRMSFGYVYSDTVRDVIHVNSDTVSDVIRRGFGMSFGYVIRDLFMFFDAIRNGFGYVILMPFIRCVGFGIIIFIILIIK